MISFDRLIMQTKCHPISFGTTVAFHQHNRVVRRRLVSIPQLHCRYNSNNALPSPQLHCRHNPYNALPSPQLHFRYNPNLVDEEDQEVESHLRRRRMNARRMSQMVFLPPTAQTMLAGLVEQGESSVPGSESLSRASTHRQSLRIRRSLRETPPARSRSNSLQASPVGREETGVRSSAVAVPSKSSLLRLPEYNECVYLGTCSCSRGVM